MALLELDNEVDQHQLLSTEDGTLALREMVRARADVVLGSARVQRLLLRRWWRSSSTSNTAVASEPPTRGASSPPGHGWIASITFSGAAAVLNLLLVLPAAALYPPLEDRIAHRWRRAHDAAHQGEGITGFLPYAEGGRFVAGAHYMDAEAFAAALQAYAEEKHMRIRRWFPLLQPRAKFLLATGSNLLLAYLVTFWSTRPGERDWWLLVWALTALVEEAREATASFEDWYGEALNVFELLSFTAVSIGMVWQFLTAGEGEGDEVVVGECYNGTNLCDFNLIGGGAALLWLSQGLRLYFRDSGLGPLVSMMFRMVGDVRRWLLLLLPVLLFFATWFYVLFRTGTSDLEGSDADDCAVFVNDEEYQVSLLRIALALVEVAMGSDNMLNCLHTSRYGYTAPSLMTTYLVIVLVLLMNMLIAMMAKTFDLVWDRQTVEFQFLTAKLVLDYEARDAVPIPLSLLSLPYRMCVLLASMWRRCRGQGDTYAYQPLEEAPLRGGKANGAAASKKHAGGSGDAGSGKGDGADGAGGGGKGGDADGAGGSDRGDRPGASTGRVWYTRNRDRLRQLTAAIDAYLETNAAETVVEESWKKQIGRDLSVWNRQADERLQRLASQAATAQRVAAIEDKLGKVLEQQAALIGMVSRGDGGSTARRDTQASHLSLSRFASSQPQPAPPPAASEESSSPKAGTGIVSHFRNRASSPRPSARLGSARGRHQQVADAGVSYIANRTEQLGHH